MICFLSSSRTVKACCQTSSYSRKIAHRPIRLASLKNESSNIVRGSSRRKSGHQIHLTSILSTTTSAGTLCLSGTKCSLQSQLTRLNSRLCWRQSSKDLPQEAINLAGLAFRKRLQACIRAHGDHFEHLLK